MVGVLMAATLSECLAVLFDARGEPERRLRELRGEGVLSAAVRCEDILADLRGENGSQLS